MKHKLPPNRTTNSSHNPFTIARIGKFAIPKLTQGRFNFSLDNQGLDVEMVGKLKG
jgi:hypothetical protein